MKTNILVYFQICLSAHLSLIKSCSACVRQNTAVKTASVGCSLSPKKTLSDLIGQRPSVLIINFEQGMKAFLVSNIYFTFFFPVLIALFTRVLVRIAVCYYHVTYAFQSESTPCSCLNVKELLAWNRRNIWSFSEE